MFLVVAHRRVGQPVRTCQRCWSERLAFISRPMATFTPWAAAPRIRQGLTSSTCSITTHLQQLDADGSTLPDNQMNNMACGVLTVSGTP